MFVLNSEAFARLDFVSLTGNTDLPKCIISVMKILKGQDTQRVREGVSVTASAKINIRLAVTP